MTAAAAVALVGVVLVARGPDRSPATPAAGTGSPADEHGGGVRVGCSTQSGADFPGAFTDRRNLVVGPLVLVGGGTYTDAATVREFGGNKFPLIVRAGHTVTVKIPPGARNGAGLGYGGLPQGRSKRLRAARPIVTFESCSPKRSQSSADGPVTFWSGFVLIRAPTCVALDVYVDDQPRRRVGLPLGRRCGRSGDAPAPASRSRIDPSAKLPLRDCRSRAEGGRPSETASRPGDVVVGPFAFSGLERAATRRGLDHYRGASGYGIKAGAGLRAGVSATLVIGRQARRWASLTFAARNLRRVSDGDPAVRFKACPADEPAFGYDGPVGITTGFAGGFILSRPGCVPLEVRIAGRPTVQAVVPFGVGSCPGGR